MVATASNGKAWASQAQNKLTNIENINVTKYLNGWLNIGRQKGNFREVSEYQCCRWHEDSLEYVPSPGWWSGTMLMIQAEV